MTRTALIWSIALACSCLMAHVGHGQTDTTSALYRIAGRIFLPSVDVGLQVPTTSRLKNSITIKTSVEYRLRNNNDFFIRLSYDTYGSDYRLPTTNLTTNAIEGTAQFTDLCLSPGYRFGDRTFRCMFAIMPGFKFYDFPTAEEIDNTIVIRQGSAAVFTTALNSTVEYYFDEKSALTLSFYGQQVWDQVDFWDDGTWAYGFSVGFITSLL